MHPIFRWRKEKLQFIFYFILFIFFFLARGLAALRHGAHHQRWISSSPSSSSSSSMTPSLSSPYPALVICFVLLFAILSFILFKYAFSFLFFFYLSPFTLRGWNTGGNDATHIKFRDEDKTSGHTRISPVVITHSRFLMAVQHRELDENRPKRCH